MRFLLPALIVFLLLLALAGHGAALAKGGGFAVTPDSGGPGAEVELSSDYWQPRVPVQIFLATALRREPPPTDFSGPIASTVSDAQGKWSVRVQVADAGAFRLPSQPAFVFYKAVSPEPTAIPSAGSTEGVADFALVVGGRRPNGAGGVRLTIEANGVGSGWLNWEPAGSATFYISIVGPFGFPLRDYEVGRLTDGDWDFVVPSTLVPVTAVGGRVMTIQATLCASPSIACDPRPDPLSVVRVPIREGRVVDVTITMGEPAAAVAAAPMVGTGPAGANPPLVWISVMLAAGGVCIVSGACVSRARRRGRL